MKHIVLILILIASLFGLSNGRICALNLRERSVQNFANFDAMNKENIHGGREYIFINVIIMDSAHHIG